MYLNVNIHIKRYAIQRFPGIPREKKNINPEATEKKHMDVILYLLETVTLNKLRLCISLA